MKRLVICLVGLLLPLTAQAQQKTDWLAQARQKELAHDDRGAIVDFGQAIVESLQDPRPYLGRASAECRLGLFSAAISDETKAIALDPKNPVAYSNRGNARAASGDLDGAVADYTQAIVLDPNHDRAYLNRGTVRSQQKDYPAAIADYGAAIALNPKNPVAWYDRAGAKRAMDDLEGALADYSQVIVLTPADAYAWLNRAVLKIALQDWKGAGSDLHQCLQLIPEERQAYVRIYLWVVAMHQGGAAQASKDLQRHLAGGAKVFAGTWPGQIESFLAGKIDEAQFLSAAASQEAQKKRGQTCQAYYYVGLKRALAGDAAGAAQFFDKCVVGGDASLHEYVLSRHEPRPTGAAPK